MRFEATERMTLRSGRVRPLRRAAHGFLALLLVCPTGLGAAPATGTIQGTVKLQGRPLSGVTVAFIELQSGSVVRAVSSASGDFSTVAPTGEYAVTTESQAGLAVGHAPVKVAVGDGRAFQKEAGAVNGTLSHSSIAATEISVSVCVARPSNRLKTMSAG